MKCIYAIINLKNGKKYIGSTTNFSRRKKKHLNMLKKNIHHSKSLQHSYNKNKLEDFKFIIIKKLDDSVDMYKEEQYFLDKFNTYTKGIGYNMSKIAKGIYIEYKKRLILKKYIYASIGLMAYLFPSIGNPILFGPQAVIMHIIALYLWGIYENK